jgi:hypothetical protein
MMRCVGAAVLLAGLASAGTIAEAQTVRKPEERSVARVQADCTRQFGDALWCSRVADQARSRYGDTVTGRQWQSSIGVVRAKMAQGKF